MARPRYVDTVDHINNAQYKVMLSENYAPVSGYYTEFNVAPLYEHDPNSQGPMATGVATIAQMIDMYANKYTFVFCDDRDILDVDQVLARYIKQAHSVVITDREVKNFIEKAMALHQAIEKEKMRVFKTSGIEDPAEKTITGLLRRLFYKR